MPTARPRHMITETDEIARILDEAAEIWPDLANERSALIRKVLLLNVKEVELQLAKKRRLEAIQELSSGKFDGIFPENWREDQLAGWPA